MRSPITKIAIAAIVILGVLVWVQHLTGHDRVSPSPKENIVQETVPQQPQAPQPQDSPREVTVNELELARSLYERKDQQGLLTLLASGEAGTRIRVAEYLEEIGDESAVPALQRLADALQGDSEANPFKQAIDSIESRSQVIQPELNDPNVRSQSQADVGPNERFKPQGVLSGLITDALTGAPVGGVEVELPGDSYRARTDERGFYSIKEVKRSGRYRIRINSKAYLGMGQWSDLPKVTLSPDKQAVKHFALQLGCRAQVEVIDEQGIPLEDVDVSAGWLGTDFEKLRLGEGATDPDGVWIVGPLESSEIAYRITARHEAYAPAHATIKVMKPRIVEKVQIVMKQGVEVHGYAAYTDSVPAAGLEVSAEPDWWHSAFLTKRFPVDAQGNFTLQHVAPGNYSIRISIKDENNPGMSRTFSIAQTELPLSEGKPLVVRVPQKSPSSLVAISGQIIWASAQKPTIVHISIQNQETNEYRTIGKHYWDKEADDLFIIGSLEPGHYTLKFEGANLEPVRIDNVQAPSRGLEVVLEYQDKPYVFGQVMDRETREPIASFEARVVKLRTLSGANYEQSSNWVTCKFGRFGLEVVGPGIYRVEVLAEGYAPVMSPEISTESPESVTVQLGQGGTITGQVVDPEGNAVHGATVIPLSKAHGNMPRTLETFVSEKGSVKTDKGAFILENIPAGEETLRVVHPEYTSAAVSGVEVFEGQTTRGLRVVLSSGGAVQGTVYRADGRPDSGVTLDFQDQSGYGGSGDQAAGRLAVVVTDGQGRYKVSGLPADRICYVVRRNMNVLGVIRRSFVPLEGETTLLDFGGSNVIAGSVVLDGEPVGHHRVILTNPGNPHFGAFRYAARTDERGRFTMQGIPAGRFSIYSEQMNERGKWDSVTTLTTHSGDHELGVLELKRELISIEVSLVGDGLAVNPRTVHMREGTEFAARRVGDVTPSSSDNTSYVIEHVPPGMNQIAVYPATGNGWRYRQLVEISVLTKPNKVTLHIPHGSASVEGTFSSLTRRSLTLWNADRSITANIYPPGEAYYIEYLPAGDYMIGDYFVGDLMPLAEFSLTDGEHRVLDLDTSAWPNEIGSLDVYVMNDHGNMINHAHATLKGNQGQVEPRSQGGGVHSFYAYVGDHALLIQCEGFQDSSEHITVEPYRLHTPGEEAQRVVVRLKSLAY